MAKSIESKLKFTFVTVGDKAQISAHKQINKATREHTNSIRELTKLVKENAKNISGLTAAVEKQTVKQKLLNKETDIAYRNNRNLLGSFSVLRSKLLLATFAIGALTKTFGKYIDVSSSFEETMNKFNVVFGESTDLALQFANTLGNEVGRSVIDITEMMAGFQDTFVPLGFARDQSAELSKSLTKLAMDVASFQNRADTEVVNAFTSAIVGNHEAVRRYGIVLTEAQLQSTALREGIIKTERELTAQEKVLARMLVIYDATRDAENDLIETQDSYTNQLKAFNAELKDLQKAIGDSLIPLAENLLKLATHFADKDTLLAYAIAIGTVTGAMVGLNLITKAATTSTLAFKAAVFALGGKAALMTLAIMTALYAEELGRYFRAQTKAKESTDDLSDSVGDNTASLKESVMAVRDAITAFEDLSRQEIEAAQIFNEARIAEEQANIDKLFEYILNNYQMLDASVQMLDEAESRKKTLLALRDVYKEFFDTVIISEEELARRTLELNTSTYDWKIKLLNEERDKHKKAKLDQNVVDAWYTAEKAKLDQEVADKAEKIRLKANEKHFNELKNSIKILFKDNLDFQLALIDEQAQRFEQQGFDEIAITEFTEQAKTDIIVKHLEKRNVLYASFMEGYDTFINSLTDMEMSGKDRREKVWEATKAGFVKMLGEMLKERIKALIVQEVITKAGTKSALLTNAITAAELAAFYATPAALAATASFGGAAEVGLAAIVASVASTKALAAIGSAAEGADFITSGKQIMMVGDNPSGREHVKVTPLPTTSNVNNSTSSVINVNIYGGIVQDDYVRNELLPAINKAKALA
jgi:hypothetical protein